MSAAGGRHGLWGSGPEGVHSGLPAGAPVPGGGHRAGGSPQNPNAAMSLRSAETGSFTTIDLLTCRPRIPAGGLLQVRSGAQLS